MSWYLPGYSEAMYYPAAEEGTLPGWRRNYYLRGTGLIFGCVRGLDTIACATGVWPAGDLRGMAPFKKRSNDPRRLDYGAEARHDLEVSCVASDTTEHFRQYYYDEIMQENMEPIGLELHSLAMGWKRSYLSRALIIDNWIVNKAAEPLYRGTLGVTVNAEVYNVYVQKLRYEMGLWWPTTTCGMLRTVPGIVPGVQDTINIAWAADTDGDAEWTNGRFNWNRGLFSPGNPTAVAGVRVLSAPRGARFSFNWFDWGWSPRFKRSEPGTIDPGWPSSDRALYRIMTNGEIDYDQAFAAVDFSAEGWYPPSPESQTIARGFWPDLLLSVGPFDDPIMPGDSIRFTYAIVMGDDFHTDPDHFANTFDYNNPAPYLNGLNFTNLISAAQWAGWFFDNPGVDTDGDGYAGEFYLVDCRDGCDSVYYSGDGVPDFKGPLPPPPPDDITFETFPTKIIARWTGKATEFARDRHMRRPDWEGYNVYLAVDDTAKGWSLVGSWDRQDYVRYSYHDMKENWIRNSQPHTIEEWRQILSDPEFDPREHSMPSFTSAYFDIATDTVRTAAGTIVDIVTHDRWSYFGHEAADHQNEYEDNGRMHPNSIQLVGTVDTLIDGEIRQYGIYEYEIDDLSQSNLYWITVSAFDYGDYRNFIDPEESVPGENALRFQPVNSADVVVDSGLKVNVHPNPYKSEFYDNQGNLATYHSQGFEYSPSGKFNERDRRIWFTNLPDTAVIEIYSLDGDLIRLIRHPDDFLTRYESVVGWDLISRNTQAVTSGIYIWKVTSRLGSQVGKLVIIK